MLIKSEIISLLNDVLKQTAKLRKGGEELIYYCPNCHHHKRKLEVCLEKGKKFGIFHCWTCSISGNLGKLLKIVNASTSYRDKLYKLLKDIGKFRKEIPKNEYESLKLPDEFRSLLISRNCPEYRNAMAYIKRRGILDEDILRYNIGYCDDGPYEQHIIIPSYDAKGELNFFIGRRYYQSEGVIPHKKPEVSMNIVGFESFINYNEPINICEGVFDGIAIRNNAVPLFGKFPSPKLREAMIINGTPRVNMILDNDAMEDAIKNCKIMMRLGIPVHFVKLDGKDPSVLGFDKIHELIKNAPEFTQDDLLKHALEL
jgi:transcription elongation factor Elf1